MSTSGRIRKLCSREEINLATTLGGGQSFRWFPSSLSQIVSTSSTNSIESDSTVTTNSESKSHLTSTSTSTSTSTTTSSTLSWLGVVKNEVISLIQQDEDILFQNWNEESKAWEANEGVNELLLDYLQLNICTKDLYKQWSEKDNNFKVKSSKFPGVRILRQEPVENLFSFICSSNNNISRITKMIEKLCSSYGNKIAEIEGKEYFSFPAIEKLSGDNIEKELREAGFGYRAKYISDTAKYLQENQIDEAKLRTYRKETYQTTKDFLLKLSGVGPKVADCICLMSMDKLEAVPIDTHVFRYSMRDYKFMNQGGSKLKTKASFSKIDYQQLGDYFRDLHGPFAGWAQSILFVAELGKFEIKEENQEEPKPKRRKKK